MSFELKSNIYEYKFKIMIYIENVNQIGSETNYGNK